MITSIPMALAAGSALLAAATTFYIILFVFSKISNKRSIEKINTFISPMAWNLAFLISLFSLLGSLFFSEVLGFQPCVLCWYQRRRGGCPAVGHNNCARFPWQYTVGCSHSGHPNGGSS